MRQRLGLLTAALACLALVAPAAASASSKSSPSVPSGFVGMNIDDPLYPDSTSVNDLESQLNLMVASGVETLHIPIYWSSLQPFGSWGTLPAKDRGQFDDIGGVPTSFSTTDQLVGEAAARGMSVVPTVLGAPGWDGKKMGKYGAFDVPRSDAPYATFLTDLVARYGSGGTFWNANPQLTPVPITQWQIWNEPNLQTFWPEKPWSSSYVALLHAAHTAIKAADPAASVVLGGLTNYSWDGLDSLYKAGAQQFFDVAAVHPYTKQAQGVISILNRIRGVMNRHGDGNKSMIADEFGWPSSIGQTNQNYTLDFGTTEAGQARDLSQAMRLFARNSERLKLAGIDYFTWVSEPRHNGGVFDFAGLLSYTKGKFDAKPALGAFSREALAIEHCRKKGTLATSCVEPS